MLSHLLRLCFISWARVVERKKLSYLKFQSALLLDSRPWPCHDADTQTETAHAPASSHHFLELADLVDYPGVENGIETGTIHELSSSSDDGN